MTQTPSTSRRLIDLLQDHKWHSSDEIASKVSWRFGATIHEARRKGYVIDTRKVANDQYEYRLITCQYVTDPPVSLAWSYDRLVELSSEVGLKMPYLRLLILFGSRARGDASEDSDWDFAILYDEEQWQEYEKNEIWFGTKSSSILEETFKLSNEELDVVDLGSCSELLAHSIAHDGRLLYERKPGEFEEFKERALKTSEELKASYQQMRASIRQKLEQLKD
ncbi:MAG: nucleotidyltransferase domain-containing protein [Cyanothece sp. SIO1E1]|nr:nucleotidyltransferase domain-containing protein [Cyanothece sp. SIO1E1]